jgi:hypothetical protein
MKDSTREAAEYAIRVRAQEAKKLRTRLDNVARRIKVGDLVNHHGFLGIVTRKEVFGFAFETLEGGKPNGPAGNLN